MSALWEFEFDFAVIRRDKSRLVPTDMIIFASLLQINLILEEKQKPYNLNLDRFKNHKKAFPWLFVTKIIVGLGMAAFIYYMTMELFREKSETPTHEVDATEIEISTD